MKFEIYLFIFYNISTCFSLSFLFEFIFFNKTKFALAMSV